MPTTDAPVPPALHRMMRAWHERARRVAPLHRVAIVCRIVLGLAFVPQAVLKLQGVPFTGVGTDTTIGYFFDALYQTGMYWRFIGASQIVAGALLLVPATATLGAVLFLPAILNIFVITTSLHFPVLPIVTGLMSVACLFLLCWDYHRLAPIVWGASAAYVEPSPPRLHPLERAGYVVGSVGALGVLLSARMTGSASPSPFWRAGALALVVAGIALCLVGWIAARRARAPLAGELT